MSAVGVGVSIAFPTSSGGSPPSPPAETFYLIQEGSGLILQENGSGLLQE